MGVRCYILIFCFIIQWLNKSGFALDCDLAQKNTCEECRQCGGLWCNDPNEARRCVPLSGGGDEWCPELLEPIPEVYLNSQDGTAFRPQYEDVLAEINSGKVTTLHFTGGSGVKSIKTPYYKIINATRFSDKAKIHVQITKRQSRIQVTTTVNAGFCSPMSHKFEYAYVEVGMSGVSEKAVLKYMTPCGCDCSNYVVRSDQRYCHGHGDFMCGICHCNEGWHGKYCECGPTSSSCVDPALTMKCSGNGVCDKCKQCQCFNNKEGSQYFDKDDNCKDLSATVKDFLNCQKNEQSCGKCDNNVFFHKWDESLLNQLYDSTRKLWVDLGSSLPGYWGTMVNSTIHVMRKPLC